jgi:hypothetical protein
MEARERLKDEYYLESSTREGQVMKSDGEVADGEWDEREGAMERAPSGRFV